jgi:class 3 adenylate cyclase
VGSTSLYRKVGDARAFHFVWRHFEALRAVIEREGGVLVKTIGDAVMAVFLEPAAALRAAGALHAAMEAPNLEAGLTPPVGLRVGLAQGPAYAVSLNGRLDYFGTTVNLAARVQGHSQGGDVVAPVELVQEAGEALAGWRAEAFCLEAKGFEAPVQAIRFTPASPSESHAA